MQGGLRSRISRERSAGSPNEQPALKSSTEEGGCQNIILESSKNIQINGAFHSFIITIILITIVFTFNAVLTQGKPIIECLDYHIPFTQLTNFKNRNSVLSFKQS